MNCRTLSKAPGLLRSVKKPVGAFSVHFKLEVHTLGILSTPTDENLQNLVENFLHCTPKTKCLWTYIDTIYFQVVFWATHS